MYKAGLKRARRSSRDSACRKTRIAVLDFVKGRVWGMTPTELTVSLYMRRCVNCSSDGPMCLGKIVPHADEVDVNVDGKRLLEGR